MFPCSPGYLIPSLLIHYYCSDFDEILPEVLVLYFSLHLIDGSIQSLDFLLRLYTAVPLSICVSNSSTHNNPQNISSHRQRDKVTEVMTDTSPGNFFQYQLLPTSVAGTSHISFI